MKLIDFHIFICESLDKLVKTLYNKEDKFKNFHNIKNIMRNIWTSYVERASIITNG